MVYLIEQVPFDTDKQSFYLRDRSIRLVKLFDRLLQITGLKELNHGEFKGKTVDQRYGGQGNSVNVRVSQRKKGNVGELELTLELMESLKGQPYDPWGGYSAELVLFPETVDLRVHEDEARIIPRYSLEVAGNNGRHLIIKSENGKGASIDSQTLVYFSSTINSAWEADNDRKTRELYKELCGKSVEK